MNSDILISFSSVFLAILTGIYVLLTYKLLKENKKSNEQQFRILTFPHLYCEIKKKGDKCMLVTYNVGNVPVYDVDILVVGVYSEEDIDIQTFMNTYVRTEYRNYNLQPHEERFYGIYDHICYLFFPTKKKIIGELNFCLRPDSVYILLQYRGILGINYSQVYWFFEDLEGNIYKLGGLDPEIITSSPRVTVDADLGSLDLIAPRPLKTLNGNPLPKHVKEKFLDVWIHSIPSGCTKVPLLDAEDRGKWEDI